MEQYTVGEHIKPIEQNTRYDIVTVYYWERGGLKRKSIAGMSPVAAISWVINEANRNTSGDSSDKIDQLDIISVVAKNEDSEIIYR